MIEEGYISEIKLIIREHEETLSALSNKQAGLERFKLVMTKIADELDELKDNSGITSEDKARSMFQQIAKMERSQKVLELQIKPLTDKIKELEQRSTSVLEAIQSRHPEYTLEDIRKTIAASL